MKRFIILALFIGFVLVSCKTEKHIVVRQPSLDQDVDMYRVMFYNVENLFDTEDDPLTADEEFTPEGVRYWTEYRYKQKLNNIYKVIIAVGGWELPQIIGFSELENRKVLEDLINNTPLYKTDYKIVHYDSPDRRGIDVGLIYREGQFKPFFHKPIPVKWPVDIGTGTTRDILLVSGITNTDDTLNIFVNHWPSRWGGQLETEDRRMYVAKLLKKQTDSLFRLNPEAKIIIMGDLNDYPTDRSVVESLKTETQFENIKSDKLYNLSYYLQEVKKQGTYKYEGQWGILDQLIVSGALLDTSKSMYTTVDDAHVFKADFLLEKDDKYPGEKVFRTYIGYKYNGGYSDHLPTFVDLRKKKH
jgi:predicted extracellular nuclease